MSLPPQPLSDGRHRELVVLLHAYRHTPDRLASVADAVRESMPDAHVILPQLPLQIWSTEDLNHVSAGVVALIDLQVEHRAASRLQEFDKIILVGHSTGSMIARKVYVIACGETQKAPFEHRDQSSDKPLHPGRVWADQVERIIQLAGMNGGWSVSHNMGMRRALEFTVGSVAGNLILSATGRRLAIFQIRRGAPFLSGLRLQWLAMQEEHAKRGKTAMVVQLLGTVDDLVAPEDNVDLVSGAQFLYLDVPFTGHVNVIEMGSSAAGKARSEAEEARLAKFQLALVGQPEKIREQSVEPFDYAAIVRDKAMGITDVVFVIHGIRDTGYWTHKIARRVQAHGRTCNPQRTYATETSTYGYFPMLSFLLPSRRHDKVAWLMDRYARAKSLYPQARFSYLGHSNGTYLLARALQDNPACRFERVVFAGSVVRTDYDWAQAARRGQVNSVLNYVATNDKIVACFPGALEQLQLQDLGSAGHNGFVQAQSVSEKYPTNTSVASSAVLDGINQPNATSRGESSPERLNYPFFEVRFVEGGHSAALSEEQWDNIAQFICTGQPPESNNVAPTQNPSAMFLGEHPLILWAAILAVLVAVTVGIWQIPVEWLRTLLLIGFGWLVVKILTRF